MTSLPGWPWGGVRRAVRSVSVALLLLVSPQQPRGPQPIYTEICGQGDKHALCLACMSHVTVP